MAATALRLPAALRLPSSSSASATPFPAFHALRAFESGAQKSAAELFVASGGVAVALSTEPEITTGLSAVHLAARSGAAVVGDDATAAALIAELRRAAEGDGSREQKAAFGRRDEGRGMTALHYAALLDAPLTAQALLADGSCKVCV